MLMSLRYRQHTDTHTHTHKSRPGAEPKAIYQLRNHGKKSDCCCRRVRVRLSVKLLFFFLIFGSVSHSSKSKRSVCLKLMRLELWFCGPHLSARAPLKPWLLEAVVVVSQL